VKDAGPGRVSVQQTHFDFDRQRQKRNQQIPFDRHWFGVSLAANSHARSVTLQPTRESRRHPLATEGFLCFKCVSVCLSFEQPLQPPNPSDPPLVIHFEMELLKAELRAGPGQSGERDTDKFAYLSQSPFLFFSSLRQ